MKYLLLIPILFLFACNSQKRIQTSQTRVDSVASSVVKELKEKHSLDSASWANEKRQISETGVVFENDPCPPCDTAQLPPFNTSRGGSFTIDSSSIRTVRNPNKLEFYPNGTLKSAEGKIKALNQKNEDWQREAYTWKIKYDSLAAREDSSKVTKNVAIETKEVVKRVQIIPWWIWLACGLFAVLWIYGVIPKPKRKLI